MLRVEDYVRTLEDERFELKEIRTEEGNEMSLEELKRFVYESEERGINPIIGTDGQIYCVWCMSAEKEMVAFDIENKTEDKLFLFYYFEEEIYGFDALKELFNSDKAIPTGVEDMKLEMKHRKRFDVSSKFLISENSIEVNDLSYPYKIERDDFMFYRYDYNFDGFCCCDDCVLIHHKNGRVVKLFFYA